MDSENSVFAISRNSYFSVIPSCVNVFIVQKRCIPIPLALCIDRTVQRQVICSEISIFAKISFFSSYLRTLTVS